MKMQLEHYRQLVNHISEWLLSPAGRQAIADEHWLFGSDERRRWDAFHIAVPLTFCHVLTGYLNDAQIDTALRRIQKDLSI